MIKGLRAISGFRHHRSGGFRFGQDLLKDGRQGKAEGAANRIDGGAWSRWQAGAAGVSRSWRSAEEIGGRPSASTQRRFAPTDLCDIDRTALNHRVEDLRSAEVDGRRRDARWTADPRDQVPKTRLVPLHDTAVAGLKRYLARPADLMRDVAAPGEGFITERRRS